MRKLFLIGSILFLTACSVEPGSEKWCAMKKDQSKADWTGSDAMTYASKCLLEGTTVGSAEWCKNLSKKPKGEWSADDATSYAKHCVI